MELDIGGVVESTGWLDGSGSGGACEHEICFFFCFGDVGMCDAEIMVGGKWSGMSE